MVNPAFHRSRPLSLFAGVTHKVFKLIDSNNGGPVEVTDVMDRFALDSKLKMEKKKKTIMVVRFNLTFFYYFNNNNNNNSYW